MRFYANFSWTEVVSVRGHRCWEIGWWKQWKPCFFVGLSEENQSFWWFLPRKPGILELSFSHFTACYRWSWSKVLSPCRCAWWMVWLHLWLRCPAIGGRWGRSGRSTNGHEMAMKKWRTWSSGGNMWESGAVNHFDPENGTMKCMKHDNTLWLVLTRCEMSRRSLG